MNNYTTLTETQKKITLTAAGRSALLLVPGSEKRYQLHALVIVAGYFADRQISALNLTLAKLHAIGYNRPGNAHD